MIKFADYEVPRYIECDSYSDGLSRVKRKIKGEILFGFINAAGKEVIPCKYDYAYPFNEGFSIVESNNRINFINTKGQKLLNFLCKNANEFSEGLAAVQGYNDLWGFVDTTGRKVIPCKFKEVSSFHEGLCVVVTEDNNTYLLNKNGVVLDMPEDYDYVSDFKGGISKVGYHGNYGLINSKREELLPCSLDSIDTFCGDLARVSLRLKKGIINKRGEFVIPLEYSHNDIIILENGNIVLAKKGRFNQKLYGIVNSKGEVVVPFEYYDVLVRYHIVILEKGNKSLYLTRKGELISAEEAVNLYEILSDDLMITYQFINSNCRLGFKNRKTGYSISPKYTDRGHLKEEMIAVCNEDLEWGFVDISGREVIPCQYQKVESFSNGLAFVRDFKENEYFIDKTGQKVIDLMNYNSFIELNSKTIVISASSPLTRVKKKKAMLKALSQAVLDDVNNLGWELESEQNRLKLTLEGGKKND